MYIRMYAFVLAESGRSDGLLLNNSDRFLAPKGLRYFSPMASASGVSDPWQLVKIHKTCSLLSWVVCSLASQIGP